MRIFGLTGPIGAGKSTVGRLLEKKGARLIDADQLARSVLEPGEPALRQVIEAFGEEVLNPDRSLNREALGAIVFADPVARRQLEGITHPHIGQRIMDAIALAREEAFPVAVIEAILIMQSPLRPMLEGVIVVDAKESVRRKRIAQRDGLSLAEINKRIEAQRPLEEAFAQAEFHLANDSDTVKLQKAVDGLWSQLMAESPSGTRK